MLCQILDNLRSEVLQPGAAPTMDSATIACEATKCILIRPFPTDATGDRRRRRQATTDHDGGQVRLL